MSEILDRVLAEIAVLADRFIERGHQLYLVGGIVRDMDLGVDLEDLDFDLTTDARPPEIIAIVENLAEAVWTQGERFGTIGCLVGGRAIEITTYRAESYSSETRKPEVVFGDDIELDLSRRDFTVNAMALRLPGGERIDPFAGRAALEARRLATPIDPEISFSDDPLRILRAARFIARYDMAADVALIDAARRLAGRLGIVSAERIAAELDKLLMAQRPSPGVAFLESVDAFAYLIEHLPNVAVADLGAQLDASPVDVDVRRAVVFAHVGADELNDQLAGLRYSNEDKRQLRSLLAGVRYVDSAEEPWSDEAVRRLVDRVGFENADKMFAVARAVGVDVQPASSWFGDLASREDLSSLDPALDGDEVMRALAIEPGRAVGDALAILRKRRIREGPATPAEELAYLQQRFGQQS